MSDRAGDQTQRVTIERLRDKQRQPDDDVLAAEEPLEIRIGETSLAVTMRTPGHDQELAAGFLLTEGLIDDPGTIARVSHCRAGTSRESANNIIVVELSDGCQIDVEPLKRNFYATSSCGICGKASIEQVTQRVRPIESDVTISVDQLKRLPNHMRNAQHVFGQTGGLHAAALFTPDGQLRCLREDIGRHNAVDKAIGWALLNDEWPLHRSVMMVSGRAGFEIVQKALVAGVPIIAAVSAPSSLAVKLAAENNMTLVGFLRDQGMNIYAGGQRIR